MSLNRVKYGIVLEVIEVYYLMSINMYLVYQDGVCLCYSYWVFVMNIQVNCLIWMVILYFFGEGLFVLYIQVIYFMY